MSVGGRERLVSERVALENPIGNLLNLQGVSGIKPRPQRAALKLEMLRDFDDNPRPEKLMEELPRLLERHQLLSEQMTAIELAREQAIATAQPDRAAKQIAALTPLYGLGLATATVLTREVFCRAFRNRQVLASFVGLTGTPSTAADGSASRASARMVTLGSGAS